MAFTKAPFIMALILVISIFSAMVYVIGVDLNANPNVNLDQKSKHYVGNYSGYYVSTGFAEMKDENIGESANTELLTGNNETGEVLATDNFAIPKSTQGSILDFPNYFKLLYIAPNLFLMGINVPTDVFSPYVNALGFWLTFTLLLVFVIMTFNGGNTQ